jgi:hypothetical protein
LWSGLYKTGVVYQFDTPRQCLVNRATPDNLRNTFLLCVIEITLDVNIASILSINPLSAESQSLNYFLV